MSTSPAAIREAAARVDDHRVRDADRLELERGQARPLEQRPCLVDPHMRHSSPLRGRPNRTDRRAVAARREPARVAVGQDPGGRRHELGGVGAHRDAPGDLVLVDPPRALGGRIGPHLVERPAEVHRRRPRRGERLVGGVEVVALPGGERQAVRGGDADRRRAAHRERPDRLGELRRIGAAELDHLVREPPLIEDDDRVVLEPDDAVRLEVSKRAPDASGATCPRPTRQGTSPAPP